MKIDPVKNYHVPTGVMEPTIGRNEEVKGDRAHYFSNEPKRWDVVIFLAPEISKLGSDLGIKGVAGLAKCKTIINAAADIFKSTGEVIRPQIYYVKRVVGLPGETIELGVEGSVLINGKKVRIPKHLAPLYAEFKTSNKHIHGFSAYEIQKDAVFVLSDNLALGKDSREIGAIPFGNVEAKVVGVQ